MHLKIKLKGNYPKLTFEQQLPAPPLHDAQHRTLIHLGFSFIRLAKYGNLQQYFYLTYY